MRKGRCQGRRHDPRPLPGTKKILIGMVMFLILLFLTSMYGCKFATFWQAEPKVEVFTVFPDEEGSAMQVMRLPSELSKDKFAGVKGEHCANARLCFIAYNYNVNDEPGYEYVNFWYT